MEREKLVEYVEKGYSTREIANALNSSQTNVRLWLKRYDLKTKSKYNPTPKPKLKCSHCEKFVSKSSNKYCDDCITSGIAYHHNRTLSNLKLEELKTDFQRKKKIMQEREHRCESCGLTEWLGQPIKLEMHHIDGDADNNVSENLQLLCPNCHSLTPTYRAKNKGSISRRKIYRKKYYES